jgi:hypothetical protein
MSKLSGTIPYASIKMAKIFGSSSLTLPAYMNIPPRLKRDIL